MPEKHHTGDSAWLTTTDIAQYCQLSKNTVLTWIKRNKLKAFSLPSGHYRIEKEDFRDFLEHYHMPIKEWFFGTRSKRKKERSYNPRIYQG